MLRLWASVFAALMAVAAAHPGYRQYSGHNYGHYNPRGQDSRERKSHDSDPKSVHNHYYYAYAHNQYHGRGFPPKKVEESRDKETYYFQVGDDFGPFEYISPKDDSVQGFNIDIFHAVCKQAHKRCYYILDKYDHCWSTKGDVQSPGIGLLDGWYIGCLGLFPTQRRLNSFNFTTPYTKNAHAAVHHRAGEDIANITDLKGKKIGFVEGWATSKDCLARQSGFKHNHPGEYTPVLFTDHILLVAALKNKEVDLILTMKEAVKSEKGISAVGPEFYCTKGGLSVITHYGSKLLDWWNPAFEQLKKNGQYAKLCAEGEKKHGSRGNIHCL